MSIYVNPVLPSRILSEKEYHQIIHNFAQQRALEFADVTVEGYRQAVWDRLTGPENMLDDHNEALR